MNTSALSQTLDDLVRDLDLLVFRLEQPVPAEPDAQRRERVIVRRDLERLRDRLEVVVRAL